MDQLNQIGQNLYLHISHSRLW